MEFYWFKRKVRKLLIANSKKNERKVYNEAICKINRNLTT